MTQTSQSLRSRALAILSRREYSRLELKQKLLPYAENEDEIDALLQDLAEREWQSDERFTEMWVHSKSKKQGKMRLRQALLAKGVDSETIDAHLPDSEEELHHAIAVLEKKFKQKPRDFAEKQKQMRFLAYRGFGMDMIQKAIEQAWQNHEEENEI